MLYNQLSAKKEYNVCLKRRLSLEPIQKKERLKLTPDQLFNIYLECNAPQAPVKTILERYGLNPWDLVTIRKKVKAASLESLARPGKQGRKQQIVAVDQYQKVCKQLDETKDALAAVGHELALLKKRTS